jgi:hypothetical protein
MIASHSKVADLVVMAETGGLTRALERAFRELPAGSAQSRLTHYCGRIWDVLRSTDFIAAYRRGLVSSGTVQDSSSTPLACCLGAIKALVTEGIERGEFNAVSPSAIARLLVSSLFTRAHWCGEGADPALSGSCSRAVAETLELVQPALKIEG